MADVDVIIALIDARRSRCQRIFGSVDVSYLVYKIVRRVLKNVIFTSSAEEKASKIERERIRRETFATCRYKTTSARRKVR